MARRAILGGLAALLIVVVAAVALNENQSDPSDRAVSAQRASQAFASRGIVLAPEVNAGLAPGSKEHLRAVLWNHDDATRQGVISVIVVASTAEARALAARHPAAADRDGCGGTVATDSRTWLARNIVATLSRCNYIDGGTTLASNPAGTTINLAMHDLAGLLGELTRG